LEKNILVVPAFEPGRGGGHLMRCTTLVRRLRDSGMEAWLYFTAEENSLLDNANFEKSWLVSKNGLEGKSWRFVILDRYMTPREELSGWKKIAPVIGIDEGGSFRDGFDFLIDILIPKKFILPLPNITSPSLLPLPEKIKKTARNTERTRVLVSFGQEDSAGLGLVVARILCAKNTPNTDITLLRGALAKGSDEVLPNVRVIEAVPNLGEHLGEYDLVITHYGITAYEALYAGTPVLLASPTAYHAKLAKAAGFRTFSINPNINTLQKHCQTLAARYGLDKEGASLSGLLGGFSPQVYRHCPVCGKEAQERSTARFKDRTYRRCTRCGIIYMDRTCPPPVEYGREYFFESYTKQYGKTYIQDFPNLTAMAKRRIAVIKRIFKTQERKNLLDIGCAYGPFLAAAREEGFSTSGIDPAEDAVSYVQDKLGIHASCGFFPGCPLPSSPPYDAVTLWYVIEHFTDCAAALAEIRRILKSGGILAFSTPSFSGVSGLFSLRRFLSASPEDHFTVWSPKTCKKALTLAGFRVKKTVISGHHPERFSFLGKFAKGKKSLLYWPLLAISRIFGLGDTFEVYAEAI
jgi:spore coat polysaccharide biosynthesis predicted glycosyltransferase SpsG/SAM-dependent methyltransferase